MKEQNHWRKKVIGILGFEKMIIFLTFSKWNLFIKLKANEINSKDMEDEKKKKKNSSTDKNRI